MVMKYWLRLLLITSQVIRKTWCAGRLQHHITVRMLRVCKRAAFRNMRLWCGSAAATFGRHRSPKSRWSGEGWRDWPRWALVFSAHRSWRLGRSPRERASALRLPCFPSVTSSRERPICFFPPGVKMGSVSDRHRRKPASQSHWWCTKEDEDCLSPCRITGSSDTLREAWTCLLVIESTSIPDGDKRSPCASVRSSRRHGVASRARPTQRASQHVT